MAVDAIARMMALDAAQSGGGGGGTSDYTNLTNKPKINGVTLTGNKSLSDIGAADADDVYTKQQVDDAIDSKKSVSVSVVGDSLIFLTN